MILLSHPTGNANVRNAAGALAGAGLLGEFLTCLAPDPAAPWLRVLPSGLRRRVLRRARPDDLAGFIRARPWRELGRMGFSALGWNRWSRHETGPFSIDGVYRDLDRAAARRLRARPERFTGVYAYEDGAAESFAAARSLGLPALYDLPIGYWRAARRILAEEAERSPEWAGTLTGMRDSDAKLARKDRELASADAVFVASSFTRATLAEAPRRPSETIVIPYGAPVRPAGAAPARRAPGEPLRVLFVGSLGQRKGLRYLVEAVDSLGPGFALTLVGTVPSAPCAPLAAALRRHRHVASLPHAGILEEMSRHHVFVFPSLFEGFGLVLLEAMACGLPLIATPHTAAPDLITEGREGHLVPIRDASAIAARLAGLASDEDRRRAMGRAAILRAADFTWEKYRSTLAREVSRLTLRRSPPP